MTSGAGHPANHKFPIFNGPPMITWVSLRVCATLQSGNLYKDNAMHEEAISQGGSCRDSTSPFFSLCNRSRSSFTVVDGHLY